MSESYLQPFDTILLDMNETFMFGGDRFSLSQDYYSTYQSLGGSGLSPPEVQRAINGVYSTLDAIYLDPSKHDDFPSIAETLDALPESASISSEEKKLLVETFAIHELGMIPDSYVQAIKKLSQSHKLHLISNIWSPKKRWIELFNHLGIAECFETITFSSDSRSVKPSHVLFLQHSKSLTPRLAS